MDLKEYYEEQSKELDAGDKVPPPLASAAYKEASKKKDPLQRRELLGQELQRVEKQSKELVQLMDAAKSGVVDALSMLVEAFREPARQVRVKLLEPILNKDGKHMPVFGMKELSEDPAVAERQREKLRENFSIARQYFRDIELREVDTADNKKIVVIVGVDAEEFNAVVKAERVRIQLEKRTEQINADIERTQTEIEAARRQKSDGTEASKVAAAKAASAKAGEDLVLH